MKSIKSSNDLHNLERGNILVIVPPVMFGNDPDIIMLFAVRNTSGPFLTFGNPY